MALGVALALGSSAFAQPPPMVEAPTVVSIEPQVTVLTAPVVNPFLPERRSRWGLGIAGQMVCPLVYLERTGSLWCFVGPRLSFDFYLGKLTFDLMIGNAIAGGLGLELGTPFLQLGGATSPFSIAVRGVARVRIYTGVGLISGGRPARVGGGLGLTLSCAVGHRVSLQVQVAPELNAVVIEPGLSLDLNTWIGLRFTL